MKYRIKRIKRKNKYQAQVKWFFIWFWLDISGDLCWLPINFEYSDANGAINNHKARQTTYTYL